MEHSLELTRPWRTRAIVASAVAFLELVVLLAAGIAILGKPLSHRVEQRAEAKVMAPIAPPVQKPKKLSPGVPKLARGETSVLVLNGNGQAGAAADEAARVRSMGYLVGGVGNAPNAGYTRSLVMYRAGYRPEAVRLARDAHVKLVAPLDGLRVKDLLGAHLALVVGR
jgi:hypothetical protein